MATYNALGPFIFAAWLPFILRGLVRRGGVKSGFAQRLGFFDGPARARLGRGGATWVHAVSVGEMMIALRLIPALLRRKPGLPIVLSTGSTTALALARQRLPEVPSFFSPIDFPCSVRRALELVAPEHLVLVEEEIWPNLVIKARRRGARVTVVDARLSERSELLHRRLLPTASPGLFEELDAVGISDAAEGARWVRLGARPGALVVTGRVKFDVEPTLPPPGDGPRAVLRAAGVPDGAPVLLGGSTHQGEEEALARVLLLLRAQFPELVLVVVPRHVERSGGVQRRLRRMGLRVSRRSGSGPGSSGAADAVVVDSTGELRDWYSVATIAFVGKSLTRGGGQNPMEAVAAGCPVLFGPRMGNFAAVARQLLASGGAVEVADEGALLSACGRLLDDPAARKEIARRGRGVLEQSHGATERSVDLILGASKGQGQAIPPAASGR